MSDDPDLRDLLTGAAPPPRAGFERELRARLSDEWHGRRDASVTTAPHGTPWWTFGAAAAAVVALVITGLVWVARRADDDRIAPADTLPAPVTAPPPAAVSSTVPATSAAATATVASPPTEPPPIAPTGCFTDERDATVVAASFFADMVRARFTGDLTPVASCLDDVPSAFTGAPPYCWEDACAENRAFVRHAVHVGELTDASGATWWTASLPVSYMTLRGTFQFHDVIETWEFRPAPDGWAISLVGIEQPLPERQASLDAINAYFAALGAGDWIAAANLLQAGGASPEDRDDIRQLQPGSYDVAGIAAALERWCAAGCATAPIEYIDLTFTGGYEYTRNGQTIRASWFEGEYGIHGPPIRGGSPEIGPDHLAGWPAPGAAPAMPPYLVPSIGVAGSPLGYDSRAPETPTRYGQLWRSPVDPIVSVRIVTSPGVSPFRQFDRAIRVPGWDDAVAGWNLWATTLSLADPGGEVAVHATGIDQWRALDLAAGLERRADGPGWELPDSTLELVAEGWEGATGWAIRWPDAELRVSGSPLAGFETAASADAAAEYVDLFETGDGVMYTTAGRTTIAWAVAPGASAVFGSYGDPDAALAVVRSLQEVDRATWLAYAPPDTSGGDGCNSMFC